MSYDNELIYKLIVLGDVYVGKTTFLNVLSGKEFKNDLKSTSGVDFKQLRYEDEMGRRIKCYIWDTAGQEIFRSIIKIYFKKIAGAVLMFDVSNRDSFYNIQEWYDTLRENNNGNYKIILVGNKIDKIDRCISIDEAICMANKLNIEYFEISCKKNFNTENALSSLIENITTDIVNKNKYCDGIESRILNPSDRNINLYTTVNAGAPLLGNSRRKKCCIF